ncbi:hypothetical protein [Streptomyces sp. MBT53]|uniref:hypothetical protein n=1 Tax=Streptomyces sp. MBT53 TaxID=1488384 RepID=UPI001912140D|nr:hypothetical protein [Streptomyces sp. MBT53]MBK6014135.1 hypothetical protein [Streptomyces sp. MBT53]
MKLTVVPTWKLAVQVPVGFGCGSLLAYGSHADWWQLIPAGWLVTVPPPQPSLLGAKRR